MGLDDVQALVGAHPLGPGIPILKMADVPEADAVCAHPEPLANVPAGRARQDGGHSTLAQINREG